MKSRFFIMNLLGVFILSISSWQCEDNPIEADLSHLSLSVNTLSIDSISLSSYWVAPNLGSNERLYLGTKNGLDVPVAFVGISDHFYWDYYFDSTVTFDSLHFILYSNDSLLTQSSTPNLYFKSDSQFNESKSTYLDFEGFTTADWEDLGLPIVNVNTDTNALFTHTELVWNIMSIDSMLMDTVDSNLIRNFAIQLTNRDTNFIELLSREATSGEKDPKVKMYFRQNIEVSEDSTFRDTLNVTIYSFGDISIIDPGSINTESTNLGLSNGIGLRSLVSISFDSVSLLEGSLIRKAQLTLPIDTSASSEGYNIIVDPIDESVITGQYEVFEGFDPEKTLPESDLVILNNTKADVVFETDPYTGIGYPYRVSSDTEDGLFIISLKSFLQNITLGNETNLGFKVVANEKNDPFESIHFDLENESVKPILEIIYVAN